MPDFISIFPRVEAFLLARCPPPCPLLLALSGGADSLSLFYSLLLFRKRQGLSFHVAHIDHGWRKESQEEARALQRLASEHDVPFHLHLLDSLALKGNLEAACRKERYAFFAALCQQIPCQALLTGHHQGDQAETIFKRLLEGAHWCRWAPLKEESRLLGMRILRPLLGIPKRDIEASLFQANIQAFEDPTNQEVKFLRARLRKRLFPLLNKEFGKEVHQSLIAVGQEAQELIEYFDARLLPLLESSVQGPWGICLDLQRCMPESLLEVKYLLRLVAQKQGFFLSRPLIEQAAQAWRWGKANQLFAMGLTQLRLDRQRLFIMPAPFVPKEKELLKLELGNHLWGEWRLTVSEDIYSANDRTTSWKEGWKGNLKHFLPIGGDPPFLKQGLDATLLNRAAIKKRWSQAKVPAFLYPYFPLIGRKDNICHEFLTGNPLTLLNEGVACWRVELNSFSRH